MVKSKITVEYKDGRYGTGHYATVEYNENISNGWVELGPYTSRDNAYQAARLVVSAVAA